MSRSHLRIAISGKSGCGNTTLSSLLSQRMGLELVNYTFRNVALAKGMDFDDFYALASSDALWDRLLDSKQTELARYYPRCVLASRLALWVFPEANLKIYLEADLQTRAERVARRLGEPDLRKMQQQTQKRDEQDSARYRALYGIETENYANLADLVIDSAKHKPEELYHIVVEYLQQRGFV